MTIQATRIRPARELLCDQFVCERCGIDFTGRPNTYCKDCRSILKEEK